MARNTKTTSASTMLKTLETMHSNNLCKKALFHMFQGIHEYFQKIKFGKIHGEVTACFSASATFKMGEFL